MQDLWAFFFPLLFGLLFAIVTLVAKHPSVIFSEKTKGLVIEDKAIWYKNFAGGRLGAVVVDSSETYTGGNAEKYLLYVLPVRSTAQPPKTVLQPSFEQGDCWPMRGTKGYLTIQLAAKAFVEGFSLEHVSAKEHIAGVALEAPHNFTVYGLQEGQSVSDASRHLFGMYSYSLDDPEAWQRFPVQNPSANSYWTIHLAIGTNHGHPAYTCVYQFKVHGRIDTRGNCPVN